MKKFQIAAFFCFFCLSLQAQDIILTQTGDIIKAKVTEVTPTEVKYKRTDNINGPVYSAAKKDIQKIVYENGVIDVFNTTKSEEATAKAAAKEATPMPNEFYLHLDGGFSVPFGRYVSSGGATGGNLFDLEMGSNFKSSNWGWLLSGFVGGNEIAQGSFGASYGNVSVFTSAGYPISGVLGGATYRLPAGKKRSAFIFSTQLGYIGSETPYVSVSTISQITPNASLATRAVTSSAKASGLVLRLGAAYRLQFARKWYLLGKINYQTANMIARSVNVRTETPYSPNGQDVYYNYTNTTTSGSIPYNTLNVQLGVGFFLK